MSFFPVGVCGVLWWWVHNFLTPGVGCRVCGVGCLLSCGGVTLFASSRSLSGVLVRSHR